MCCFSRQVSEVKNTRIFARVHDKGQQSLIYQMTLSIKDEVAMVLPVPVKPGQGEKAMTFHNLQLYTSIFADLHAGFPPPKTTYGTTNRAVPGAAPRKLEVVSVGAFDASYVPTIADFSRLDERFRLPADVWQQLPGYQDFGFAVFKLKPGRTTVQPMAFTFPTARPDDIFFPTLHIHDGEIHEKEHFDHTLYSQGTRQDFSKWDESPKPAESFVRCDRALGLVQPDQHVYRRTLRGLLINGDIVVKPRQG